MQNFNFYYYNNLKKENKLPAFIRKFGKSIRIFIAKNNSLHETST